MDRQIPKRRTSGSWQAILGVALSAFLLGAVLVGYMTWDGSPKLDKKAKESSSAAKVVPSLKSEDAQSEDTPSDEETAAATEAVERVAEQQGGLDQRLAAAEQRLARLDLQAQAASGNAGRAEGLLIAFAARRTLERGDRLGYLADQIRLRFGMAQPEAVRTVIAASANPIRIDQLVARFDGLQESLATADEGPSFARLRKEVSQLFVIRREDTPSTRPDRTLERARKSLENGRIQSAIDEVKGLPGADKAESWIVDANRYVRIQAALDVLETSAVLETNGLRDGAGQPIDQPSPAEDRGAK